MNVLEQLEGESTLAFGYFQEFLKLPRPRRIADMCTRFRRTARNFELMAKKHAWQARCQAYDQEVAAQEEARFAEIRAEAERVRLQREVERRERCWLLAERLLQRVTEMLDQAASVRWSFADAVRLCNAFEELTRAACQPFAEEAVRVRGEPARRVVGTFRLYDQPEPPTPDMTAGHVAAARATDGAIAVPDGGARAECIECPA